MEKFCIEQFGGNSPRSRLGAALPSAAGLTELMKSIEHALNVPSALDLPRASPLHWHSAWLKCHNMKVISNDRIDYHCFGLGGKR
jgi:hypothetical protein